MIWHNSSASQVLKELNTDKDCGLDSFTAAERLKTYKKNELHDLTKKSFFTLFGRELKNYLSILLLVAAAVYFLIATVSKAGGRPGALTIIVLVLLNALYGAFRAYFTNKTLDRLRISVNSMTTVIRDGKETSIPSNQLVPGDIMVLKAGDYIRADGRLIDAYVLKCDEYPLTGETVPVDKIPNELFEDITPITGRFNMVYSGTSVVSGHAVAVVTETGASTELGRAESLVRQTKRASTPLKSKLTKLGSISAIICLAAAFIVFLTGIIVHFSLSEVSFAATVLNQLLVALSLAVGALPEGFPVILTVALALGAQRMRKSGVTVTNLPVAESLKDITVICTDKTGVLTTNLMSVVRVFDGKSIVNLKTDTVDESCISVLRLALICSNLKEDEHYERHANSTESAIEQACIRYTGMSKVDIDGIYPRLAELPFDSDRRLMTTVSMINGRPYAIVKGAPEIVAQRCVHTHGDQLTKTADLMAEDMLKVIGVAIKPLDDIPANPNSDELENGLTFVGFVGIEDPLDSNTIHAFRECENNDVRVIMITGDHINTACATAKRIGILKEGCKAISHEDLEKLDDAELIENIDSYAVFARVSPQDKLRIVRALQHRYNNVILTGDSANDTPALMAADIGCALGLTGSDMVKDAADLILHNNRFSSITNAVKESRRIFHSVKKTVRYLLSCHLGAILAVLFGLFIFKESPLTAAALLFVNFLIDYLPLLAFSAEPSKEALTMRKDRDEHTLLSLSDFIKVLIQAGVIAILTLTGFASGLAVSKETAATLAFAVLAVVKLVHALGISLTHTVFSKVTIKSKTMPIACGIELLLLLIFLLTPAGSLLSLVRLDGSRWTFLLISAVVMFLVDEIAKWVDMIIQKVK